MISPIQQELIAKLSSAPSTGLLRDLIARGLWKAASQSLQVYAKDLTVFADTIKEVDTELRRLADEHK